MKNIRSTIVLAVFAGMMIAPAIGEARVRDPISRKTSPEKGFFQSRPSSSPARTSSYVQGSRVVAPTYSAPVATGGTIVTAPSVQPQRVVNPAPQFVNPAPQYRSRPVYIWSR